MTREDIFKTVDHTLLAQTATWEEIKEICDDAIKFQTASVCIPASYVKRAKDYVDGKMAICTVIGFPNGYSTTAVKEYETKDITLCLEKDLYSKTGFGLVTAYPELRNEERIQKTERDLSYVAKQTKTYKNATALGKAYILYRTNPQSKTIVKYKEDRYTGEEYILLQSKIRPKEGKPLKINTIKMNEDSITLRTSQYRDESGRGRPEPIETRLSEMAEERGFGNKFSVNLKDPKIQEKFSTIFKNACNAMRQVQDAIKAVQRDALGRDEKMIDSVEEER